MNMIDLVTHPDTIEEAVKFLRSPRYKILNSFPNEHNLHPGGIITDNATIMRYECEKHSSIFKQLRWYQERPAFIFLMIKYVEVTNYAGYYRVGDVMPVKGYEIYNLHTDSPEFAHFYLAENKNHYHPVECVRPVTPKEYERYPFDTGSKLVRRAFSGA